MNTIFSVNFIYKCYHLLDSESYLKRNIHLISNLFIEKSLVRRKLRFTRIDEMIISLTPNSLQYKPMSIMEPMCYVEGMMPLLPVGISIVSSLSS